MPNIKRRKKVVVGIALGLAILVPTLLILVPFHITKKFEASAYKYSLDFSIELEGEIPVFAQQTGFTCFAVSMVIVKTYLGFDTTEQALIQDLGMQDRREGLVPQAYLDCAREVFEPLSYSVSLLNPNSEAEILNVITASLVNGVPVIFFYCAVDDWNKPNYNTHYGVIYGIDMQNERIKLSNPYGYLDELSFAELFDSLAFKNYQSEPFLHVLGRKVGYIKNNYLFVLERMY